MDDGTPIPPALAELLREAGIATQEQASRLRELLERREQADRDAILDHMRP